MKIGLAYHCDFCTQWWVDRNRNNFVQAICVFNDSLLLSLSESPIYYISLDIFHRVTNKTKSWKATVCWTSRSAKVSMFSNWKVFWRNALTDLFLVTSGILTHFPLFSQKKLADFDIKKVSFSVVVCGM